MSPTEFTPVVVSIDLDQDDGMADGKLRGVKSDAGTLMDGNGQGDAELLKALKADKAKKMEEIRKQKEKEMAENAERVAHEALMKQLSGKAQLYVQVNFLIMYIRHLNHNHLLQLTL